MHAWLYECMHACYLCDLCDLTTHEHVLCSSEEEQFCVRRFGQTEMQTTAVQTDLIISTSTKAVQTDHKIWKIPRGFFTNLGNRCGRWGPIAGFQSKSWTARQLKSEILPMFPEWDMLVEYAKGWLAQFFKQRDLSHVLQFEGAEENRRILTYKLVNPCSSHPCSNGEERVTHYHGLYPQCLWSIADQGCLRASCDYGAGHEFSIPGVYMTPQWDYSLQSQAVQLLGIMEVRRRSPRRRNFSTVASEDIEVRQRGDGLPGACCDPALHPCCD